MTIVNHYRLWCETETSYVYQWNDTEPTTCPNNPTGHTIDSNKTSIVEIVGGEADITDQSALKVAQTYPVYKEDGQFKGIHMSCPANTISITDIVIDTELYIDYAMVWMKNANDGDICELELVDKDDVLGLFSLYGYEVGVDVLSLFKLAETIPVCPGDTPWTMFRTGDTAPVLAGLYIRVKYENNHVSQDAVIGMVFDWFRS